MGAYAVAAGCAAARGSPIFTQPLSVMSRLDTFRSLPGHRERPVSTVLQAQLLLGLCSPRAVGCCRAPPELSRHEEKQIPRPDGIPASPALPHRATCLPTQCSSFHGRQQRRTLPSAHIPFLPHLSILVLSPVDDIVLMKVLQALEDLQDDALHLETEDRSTNLWESSASPANPHRGYTHAGALQSAAFVTAWQHVRPHIPPQKWVPGCLGHTFSQILFLCQFAPVENPAREVPGAFCGSPCSPGVPAQPVLPS